MPLVTYRTGTPEVTGWKYLWAKRVSGFKPEVHCARCLIGPYLQDFGLKMPTNWPVELDANEGQFVYLCGVAEPFRWHNNLHLALVVEEGATASVRGYNGDVVEVDGARKYEFTGDVARRDYPNKGRAFLTCRNYQFGAQAFADSQNKLWP